MQSHRASRAAPATTSRGLTLVEAAIVTAIAAITLSAAAPDFSGFIGRQRLDGVASQLVSDIQFARSEAVMRNHGVRISLNADAGGACYLVHTGAAADCECRADGTAACTGSARVLRTVALPTGERIGLSGSVSSIHFDPLHGTSSPTGTLRVTAASGRAIHHVVNLMGRIRSCSPQGRVSGYRNC